MIDLLPAVARWGCMKLPPLGKEPPKLVTQADLAALFGVTRMTISDWAKKKSFPVADPTADRAKYSVHEVAVWIEVEHKRRLIPRDAGDLSTGDPLLAGEGSPALERYREERAKLAALERMRQEKDLIVLGQIREFLGRFASNLRAAGRALQTAFGAEASRILEDALTDSEREINQVCGDRDLYGHS